MPEQVIAVIGCGYVGGALAAALLRRKFRVVGTTTTPARVPELAALGVSPALLKLHQEEVLREALAPCEVVYLTVAAGRGGGQYHTVYVEGVRHLLRAVRETPVRRIIYTSSTSVYGQQDGEWVDEESPTEPAAKPGRMLLVAERELTEGASKSGIGATILRLGGIWGPGRDPAGWVRRAAGQARSDGDAFLNLVHRDDIVKALLALLERPYDGILNLSNDAPVVRRELYDRLAALTGCAPVRWIGTAGAPQQGKRISNRRIKDVLGLRLDYPTMDPVFEHVLRKQRNAVRRDPA